MADFKPIWAKPRNSYKVHKYCDDGEMWTISIITERDILKTANETEARRIIGIFERSEPNP